MGARIEHSFLSELKRQRLEFGEAKAEFVGQSTVDEKLPRELDRSADVSIAKRPKDDPSPLPRRPPIPEPPWMYTLGPSTQGQCASFTEVN